MLGERLRGAEERQVVAAVLQKILGAKVGIGRGMLWKVILEALAQFMCQKETWRREMHVHC